LNNKTKKKLLISVIFGIFGIAIEVLFTALHPVFTGKDFSWSMQGKSYLWMFFIYAMIKPLFDFGYPVLKKYNILLRVFIYSVIILLIEFITGFFLEQITGTCPWKYKEGLTFFGYIRIDYIFYWMIFGYIIEYIYLLLDNVVNFEKESDGLGINKK